MVINQFGKSEIQDRPFREKWETRETELTVREARDHFGKYLKLLGTESMARKVTKPFWKKQGRLK